MSLFCHLLLVRVYFYDHASSKVFIASVAITGFFSTFLSFLLLHKFTPVEPLNKLCYTCWLPHLHGFSMSRTWLNAWRLWVIAEVFFGHTVTESICLYIHATHIAKIHNKMHLIHVVFLCPIQSSIITDTPKLVCQQVCCPWVKCLSTESEPSHKGLVFSKVLYK